MGGYGYRVQVKGERHESEDSFASTHAGGAAHGDGICDRNPDGSALALHGDARSDGIPHSIAVYCFGRTRMLGAGLRRRVGVDPFFSASGSSAAKSERLSAAQYRDLRTIASPGDTPENLAMSARDLMFLR